MPAPSQLTPEEEASFRRRRRGRNIGILAVLLGLVAIFYLITMVRLTSS
jgi:hypothetical protein